ncbi:type IV toxin-antitoxin system AbiEi family antitoxin [Photorhabdus temperata]|uniref:Transcriptional regulator AbiEi antitoxin N-terminal domain-containing protein n=1 Tax=Photorhabdus temperata J3 TaxID=1389415 RepID=U7R2S4_PHOTE|nr:type IV toxin-antitoxin system AbiEi family antitoxin domain-containing protein [Photorhabdus temperata]ERT13702.1 hypothetical protein O185_07400 [Photorhabdus temperata J3]MCT8346671.1 type IV toxin-antitoxin system AbiEi family antitoxin [Photorhabdus temperata]
MAKPLNWILNNTAPGQILLQSWLSAHGIDRSVSWKYVQNGWLERLAFGVYFRTGRTPDWVDAVQCLQAQWNSQVHVAGLTSLNQQGFSHYLELRRTHVWLCLPTRTYLPGWLNYFNNIKWSAISDRSLNIELGDFLTDIMISGRTIKSSSMELAAYEIANSVPKIITFTYADELFQGLSSLSPRKLQKILSSSQSIRTNRVFLFLAHHNRHIWASRLNETEIKLGTGNRQVEVGGKLDTTYKITAPSKFIDKECFHG